MTEHRQLWSGVQLRIMGDPICYKLRVILTATVTSMKCYSAKSFPSFKSSLEVSFSRIMHACILQRLFETSVQPNSCNFFLGLPIHRICRLLSTCRIWSVGVSPLQKTNFCCAYKQYGIFFHKQTFKICLIPCHVV